MPRIPQSVLVKGYRISKFLPLVIRGTRTLDSAISELRWLTEHILATTRPGETDKQQRKRLLKLCIRRSRAEPLQYILGSQPFGNLDIKCRPGVLIPRPETETYTSHIAQLLLDSKLKPLRIGQQNEPIQDILSSIETPKILDLCSGSGCISLLLHSMLAQTFPDTRVVGHDVSETAVALANENMDRNIKQGNLLDCAMHGLTAGQDPQVQFVVHDVLSKTTPDIRTELPFLPNIIITNPPYITLHKYRTETTRSVRKYEPELALVSPTSSVLPRQMRGRMKQLCKAAPDLQFFIQALRFYRQCESKILIMEVGDEDQARKVASCVPFLFGARFVNIEVWRDWPGAQPGVESTMELDPDSFNTAPPRPNPQYEQPIPIRGAGNVRSVVVFSQPALQAETGSMPVEAVNSTPAKDLKSAPVKESDSARLIRILSTRQAGVQGQGPTLTSKARSKMVPETKRNHFRRTAKLNTAKRDVQKQSAIRN